LCHFCFTLREQHLICPLYQGREVTAHTWIPLLAVDRYAVDQNISSHSIELITHISVKSQRCYSIQGKDISAFLWWYLCSSPLKMVQTKFVLLWVITQYNTAFFIDFWYISALAFLCAKIRRMWTTSDNSLRGFDTTYNCSSHRRFVDTTIRTAVAVSASRLTSYFKLHRHLNT